MSDEPPVADAETDDGSGTTDESGTPDESSLANKSDPLEESGSVDEPADEPLDGPSNHSSPTDRFDTDALVAYLRWGALLAFAVLAVVAGGGLYSALGSIIDVWVADRYQPIASAVVNLAVLCVAIAGVLVTLRRS